MPYKGATDPERNIDEHDAALAIAKFVCHNDLCAVQNATDVLTDEAAELRFARWIEDFVCAEGAAGDGFEVPG